MSDDEFISVICSLESQQLSHAFREAAKKTSLTRRTGGALRIHSINAPHIGGIDRAGPIIFLNQWVDMIRVHPWRNNTAIYTGLPLNSGALFWRRGIRWSRYGAVIDKPPPPPS